MLSDNIERKFVNTIQLEDGCEIETDSGFKPIKKISKTIPYELWIIKTESFELKCADNHVCFDENLNEKFIKNFKVGDLIQTKNGLEKVIFIENTIQLENMYDIEVDSEDHRYYTNGILSHNTTSVVCFFLWYILFNENKACGILANKGATARMILARLKLAYIYLPKWLQQGIEEWNKGNITLENGSSILAAATSSDSVRGNSFSALVLDEVGFIEGFQEFWRSTYPVISSGKETKVILISTFNGMNHFYELWIGAIQGKNKFVPIRVDWWEVPGRDEEWKKEQIANMGELSFAQEFGNEPLGSGNSLISGSILKKMMDNEFQPIYQTYNIRQYERPQPGHKYIGLVDTSEGLIQDYSVLSIIDITELPYRLVFIYRDNSVAPLNFPKFIYEFGMGYNQASILVENNNSGGIVVKSLNYDYEYPELISTQIAKRTPEGKRRYELGLRQTSKTKVLGCSVLKQLIEKEKLIVNDKWIIDELKHFVKKDGSLIETFEAEQGYHDDTIMSLVLFGYFSTTNIFLSWFSEDLKKKIQEEFESEAELTVGPVGLNSTHSNRNEFLEKMYETKQLVGDIQSIKEMLL